MFSHAVSRIVDVAIGDRQRRRHPDGGGRDGIGKNAAGAKARLNLFGRDDPRVAAARNSPRPRTSVTASRLRAARRWPTSPPLAVARVSRSSSSMASSTASPARALIGLPPNVEPCIPGCSNSAAVQIPMSAPMGMPPAKPLAKVMASGITGSSSP